MWGLVYMCHDKQVEVRGQFMGLVLSFYYAGPRDWTKVIRFGGKHLLPSEPTLWPIRRPFFKPHLLPHSTKVTYNNTLNTSIFT